MTKFFLGTLVADNYIPSGAEALTVIWWLVTWALLASEASFWTGISLRFAPSGFRSAIACIKASAGLGALVWLMFLASLAFLGMSFPQTLQAPASFPVVRGIPCIRNRPRS